MTVAVFGATGKTGSLVVVECASLHWSVKAFVRNAAKFGNRVGIDVIEGDAREPDGVRRAVDGCDAVLGCLGMSDITVPATDFSDSLRTIVGVMKERGVRRIVAIGSARVLDPPEGDDPAVIPTGPYANIAAEHRRNLETLRSSGLAWTLLCPLMLMEDIPPGSGKYRYEGLPPGGEETGYADLAHTMVSLVPVAESHGKRVGIASYRYRLR